MFILFMIAYLFSLAENRCSIPEVMNRNPFTSSTGPGINLTELFVKHSLNTSLDHVSHSIGVPSYITRLDDCYNEGILLVLDSTDPLHLYSFKCEKGYGYDANKKACCDMVNGKSCDTYAKSFIPNTVSCNRGFALGNDDESHSIKYSGRRNICSIGDHQIQVCASSSESYEKLDFVIFKNGTKVYIDSPNLVIIQDFLDSKCYTCTGIDCRPLSCKFGSCHGDENYKQYQRTTITSRANLKTLDACFCTYSPICDYASIKKGEEKLERILCWGKEYTKISVSKSIVYLSKPLYTKQKCPSCLVKCWNRGLIIHDLSHILHTYRACYQHGCISGRVHLGEDHEHHIKLPLSVVTAGDKIYLEAWSGDGHHFTWSKTCKPVNYCDLIGCTMCVERWRNYKCWDVSNHAIVAIPMLIFIIGLFLILYFETNLKQKIMSWFQKFHISVSCVSNNDSIEPSAPSEPQEQMPLYPLMPQSSNQLSTPYRGIIGDKSDVSRTIYLSSTSTMMYVMALLICLPLVLSCSQTTTLSSRSMSCSTNALGMETCLLSSSTRLSLAGLKQDTCLLIKSGNRSIANLVITLNSVQIKCRKNELYFTNDVQGHCSSHFNCRSVGDCYNQICEDVRTTDDLKYWEDANKFPHSSYCSRTQGCASVGCGLCSPGCLFHVTYISPKDETLKPAKVYECSEWVYEINMDIRWVTTENSLTKNLFMTPGVTQSFNDIDFTLISITAPPKPVLGKCFIERDNRTSIVDCNRRGEYSIGRIGEVQCPDENSAKEITKACIWSPHMIDRTIGATDLSCDDQSIDITKEMSLLQLPIEMETITLYSREGEVNGIFTGSAIFEMQLSMGDLQIISKSDKNSCISKFISLNGCYNCIKGAHIKMNIRTNFGSAIGSIKCPGLDYESTFHSTHEEQDINFHISSSKAIVHETCTITCPSSEEDIIVTGNLDYISNDDERSSNEHHTIINGSTDDFFSHLKIDFLGNYKTYIYGFIMLILLVLLIRFLKFIGLFTIIKSLCSKREKKIIAASVKYNKSKGTSNYEGQEMLGCG